MPAALASHAVPGNTWIRSIERNWPAGKPVLKTRGHEAVSDIRSFLACAALCLPSIGLAASGASQASPPASPSVFPSTSPFPAPGSAAIPAFPGAMGFGASTPGGRGGRVLVVDSLADDGPGTLRWALETNTGPRIVVFAVGGTIRLKREIDVAGRVTVAGQTAPGEGVVVRGARLHVVGDDVVIRGLKIRPGVGPGQQIRARDGISIGREGGTVRRVVIDGNSFAWAPDENVATWFPVSDVSITNNIIAEGLTVPSTGNTSMGLLIGKGAARVTVARNAFAHNTHRNPAVQTASGVEFVNNLVFDYGDNGTEIPAGTPGPIELHLLGNVYVPGAETIDRAPVHLDQGGPEHRYYLRDNIGPDRPGGDLPERLVAEGDGVGSITSAPVFEPSGIEVFEAEAVSAHVLATAGARTQGLDAVDRRLIEGILSGQGRRAGGPWDGDAPFVRALRLDTDADGIPDAVEVDLKTDPMRPDAGEDPDGDGYTNIEDYMNGVADGRVTHGGDCIVPAAGDVATGSAEDGPSVERAERSTENSPDGEGVMLVEAEAMDLIEGFVPDENPHASAGGLIRSDGAEQSRARARPALPPGLYDLAVRYFDENDGVSISGLRLDDELVALWPWDEDRGTAFVDGDSRAVRVLPCLALTSDTTIEIFGSADGDEPLRIDAIEFRAITP